MKNWTKYLAFATLALPVIASASEFRLTYTDYGAQPLSPLFFSASDNTFDIFDLGGTASTGIKKIAEGGDTSTELAYAGAAGSHVGAYGRVGSAPIGTGGTASLLFNVDASHPYFSFAAMLGKTNDGFIGESITSADLSLFNGSTAKSFTYEVYGLRAWDAGTEYNSQNAADLGFLGGQGNPVDTEGTTIRHHLGIIGGRGDSVSLLPTWDPGNFNTGELGTHLATITVQAVPEPSPFILVGIGLVGILQGRRKAPK